MDKKKLAMMFNVDDDDAPPFQQKQLDEYKLAHYSQGVVRKSKREKEKEAADAKKKEEEEQAAQAYADFIDVFDSEAPRQKSRSGAGFVRAGGEGAYKPSSGRNAFEEGPSRSNFKERAPSPGPVKPKPKGQRAMDAFLEEIKRDQAERESRFKKYAGSHGSSVSAVAAYESQSGSRDRGDPATTNVFVANLPTNIDENSLGMFFARMGPVGSVKIMWPRADPQHAPGSDISTSARRGMSGFVSYMTRADAEACVRELDGFDWGGSVLRVGWSKAVPIAARPMYDLGRRSRSRSRSPRRDKDKRRRSRSRSRDHHHRDRDRDHDRDRDRDRDRDYDRRKSARRSRSRSRDRRSRRHRSSSYSSRSRSRSRTPTPKDLRYLGITQTQEEFVRKVADKVRRNGRAFQTLLETREKNNPSFEFLWDDKNPGHLLYKHLLDGASLPPPPPVFDEDGPHSAYSTDSGEESERERIRKGTLGKLARKRFLVLLRGLSGKRGELARCMAFSLEHAESAAEVAEIIISSLVVDSTPVPRKIARLHLICDILHNSAASITNAWKFRQEFESRLGGVFDHLCAIYRSFPGRITAETFKKQVLSVVEVWEDWIVFAPEFTSELRRRLDGKDMNEESKEEEKVERVEEKKVVNKFKAAAFGAVVEPVKEEKDGIDGEDIDGDNLDGENMDGDNIDGENIDGDNIDGEYLDGEDLDGAPVGGPHRASGDEMEMSE
ncbi:U2 snRNP-associated SURP motif-containing protein [Rhizoctonia solani]|uniref:U2 snRNP-associated SURP motif-containing protein n=1 Tax=Rhizoctonia solani TaxID=456999 RepID=A0A0K6FKF8_9AGAM|nr:U2 snRNP-associated SURP motif-containing protein [Rhizoctonia solani]